MPRVLICDDVLSCRKMVIRLIESHCHCAEVRNGQEAVIAVDDASAAGLPFDYIIMDSSMPTMSGSDATEVIRRSGYEGKIIGLTGNALKADLKEFLSKGLDEVLAKPIEPHKLFKALNILVFD
jgi:CheY-like chemotaxis protein